IVGGTFQATANLSTDRVITPVGAGGNVDTVANSLTFSSALTGSGTLTKIGTGTLSLTASGAPAYSGAININAGTVAVPRTATQGTGDNLCSLGTGTTTASSTTAGVGTLQLGTAGQSFLVNTNGGSSGTT